jgi:hypothetical protein
VIAEEHMVRPHLRWTGLTPAAPGLATLAGRARSLALAASKAVGAEVAGL